MGTYGQDVLTSQFAQGPVTTEQAAEGGGPSLDWSGIWSGITDAVQNLAAPAANFASNYYINQQNADAQKKAQQQALLYQMMAGQQQGGAQPAPVGGGILGSVGQILQFLTSPIGMIAAGAAVYLIWFRK